MAATTNHESQLIPNLCSGYALLLLVLAAELLSVLLVVADSGLRGISWAHLGLVSCLVQWVALTSAAVLCHIQPYLQSCRALVAGLVSYAIVLLVTAIYSIAGQWYLRSIGQESIDVWQVADHVLIAAILAGLLLRYLYLQQQLQRQQQAELQARIQALQSRIEPHFLFNSMNSIASLIALDPDLAERQVEDLSDLMRASLAQTALISAQKELQLCRSYVQIEQARLAERLRFHWQIDPLPDDLLLPNLLLQPLVENALLHGVEPSVTGADVTLQLQVGDSQLEVMIANAKPQDIKEAKRRGNRMALENVRHRLAAHFGQKAKLRVDETDTDYAVFVTIELAACRPSQKRE